MQAAIKAARHAGLENFRVDVDKQGTISVVPMAPGEPNKQGENKWDEVLSQQGQSGED